jgi:hypothetical protein
VGRTSSGPGRADRAVEKLATFSNEAAAIAALPGNVERLRNIPYLYREHRLEIYPAREDGLR